MCKRRIEGEGIGVGCWVSSKRECWASSKKKMLGEQQEGMLGELQLARGWQGRVICQGGASKLRAHV